MPITVLIIIPYNIENNLSVESMQSFFAGMVFIIASLFLMVTTVSKFIRIGKCTLAPWTPTKKLVISGIYAYVRNLMITGVVIIIIGEAIAFISMSILVWAIVFYIINNIYFSII